MDTRTEIPLQAQPSAAPATARSAKESLSWDTEFRGPNTNYPPRAPDRASGLSRRTFPDAVLQNDAGRYELENVLISGCAPDSVTLNYAKVRVRGWDPEKKE